MGNTVYFVVEATTYCHLVNYKEFIKLVADEKADAIRWGNSFSRSRYFETKKRAMQYYSFLSQFIYKDDQITPAGDDVCCQALYVEKCNICHLSKRTPIIKYASKSLSDDVIKKALSRRG